MTGAVAALAIERYPRDGWDPLVDWRSLGAGYLRIAALAVAGCSAAQPEMAQFGWQLPTPLHRWTVAVSPSPT